MGQTTPRPGPVTPSQNAQGVLHAGLEELGLHLEPARAEQLLLLAELLHEWASQINLTGHRSPETIIERLVLEAIALELQMPPLETLVDLGSGAGFPGLPIAILRPERRVTLVESRLRRHHFQRAALRALGLENVSVARGRAEALEPQPHAGVVAQAMAKPGQAVAWMLPWVEPGGWVMIPGGASPPEIPVMPGLRFERCTRYCAPLSGSERTVWLGRASDK